MMAYNHEKYAEQAVRSVLMQQVDADLEIIIGEDCSKDGTRAVLESLRRTDTRIRVLLREQNIGLVPNFIETYHACRGEFIAVLSCDDYWTSPLKLQKQLDAMREHPDWSMCFHAWQIVTADTFRVIGSGPEAIGSHELQFIQLAESCVVGAVTQFIRRGLIPRLPAWYSKLIVEDWPLHILLSGMGPVGYIDETMAAYRHHPQSFCATRGASHFVITLHVMFELLVSHFTTLGQFREVQILQAAKRKVFAEYDQQFADLKRIERRYHRLGLDRIADAVRYVRRRIMGLSQ